MAQKQVTAFGYVVTFVALLALATISLLLSFLHGERWNLPVALAIATLMATLVLFYFMHLIEQRFTHRFAMLLSLLFVGLIVGLTSADVATRHTLPARPEPAADEPFYTR